MARSRHLSHLRGPARLVTCPRRTGPMPRPTPPYNAQETRFLRPRRSSLVLVTALVVGALLVLGVGVATPEPAAIQAKRAQVAQIQAELNAIDAQVEAATEAYNGARYELGVIKARIEQNKRQIKGTEADLEKSREVLGQRLRDIYATPEPTLAEVVINSGSITAAADQLDLLDKVGEQDASVVGTLKSTRARLQALRAELLTDEQKAESAVAQAAARSRRSRASWPSGRPSCRTSRASWPRCSVPSRSASARSRCSRRPSRAPASSRPSRRPPQASRAAAPPRRRPRPAAGPPRRPARPRPRPRSPAAAATPRPPRSPCSSSARRTCGAAAAPAASTAAASRPTPTARSARASPTTPGRSGTTSRRCRAATSSRATWCSSTAAATWASTSAAASTSTRRTPVTSCRVARLGDRSDYMGAVRA